MVLFQELQEQISTSDSVSSDVQDVFGRQLLVLQGQRDCLLEQLEQQKADRSSFVDVLEEKNALEDNLRREREHLAEKLRQKEVLERELNRERAQLQEQLIKQAKLNEIVKQKDLFERELVREKSELQVRRPECLVSPAGNRVDPG